MKLQEVAMVAGLLGASVGLAQDGVVGGCMRLLGSVACPGFQYAYLSPTNLSNAFPFFTEVTDVASFDVAALNYFSNPYQFTATKFEDELGCSNASSAVIQYERTVLCSMWVNEVWSAECLAFYNGTSAATSQKMVCQSTCLQYAASELSIVNSSTYCPGPDLTNGNRSYQLNKDYVDCTNWTSLATNETQSCVSGSDNEENCGFGTSTTQLCNYCSGSEPDDCCYSSGADVSVCGYVLPTRVNASSTSSSASPTGSGSLQNSNSSSSSQGLSGGQIAGIVVGSVIGGLLLLGLLLFCCLRRRKQKQRVRDSGSSFAAPAAVAGTSGIFSSMFSSGRPSTSNAPNNSSEKGLLGHGSAAAAASSPTMGGDTLYAGSGHNKSVEGATMLGAPAAGVGAFGMAGGGGTPGERTSGVVLPRVKDENQHGDVWIETGAEVTVLWPYQATLPDELDLRPGMKLRVLRLYDDAWGTAQVMSGEGADSGRQGAFPIVCVSEGSSFGSSQASSAESHSN